MTETLEPYFWWFAIASVLTFAGTLIVVPILVARIPGDYFAPSARRPMPWRDEHPVMRIVLLAAKNLLGLVLLLAGVAMLVLPGQGLLTIAVGLMLVSFPGKYRLERWLVSRGPVLRAINWLRRRRGRPPLVVGRDATGS